MGGALKPERCETCAGQQGGRFGFQWSANHRIHQPQSDVTCIGGPRRADTGHTLSWYPASIAAILGSTWVLFRLTLGARSGMLLTFSAGFSADRAPSSPASPQSHGSWRLQWLSNRHAFLPPPGL
eukprot:1514013-Rhodomonas_salina.1